MRKDFLKLEKRAKEIEKQYGSLENFVKSTTKAKSFHRMRIEGQMPYSVLLEMQELEKIDLVDFEKFEKVYGEFS